MATEFQSHGQMWTIAGRETCRLSCRRWFRVSTNLDSNFLFICMRSFVGKMNPVLQYFGFQSFHFTIWEGYCCAQCNYYLASFLIPELLSSRFENYVYYALHAPMYFGYRNTQYIHWWGLSIRVTVLKIVLKLIGVQWWSIDLLSYFVNSCVALSCDHVEVYLR